MTYQSINPSNGKLVESFPLLGEAALETKIRVSRPGVTHPLPSEPPSSVQLANYSTPEPTNSPAS